MHANRQAGARGRPRRMPAAFMAALSAATLAIGCADDDVATPDDSASFGAFMRAAQPLADGRFVVDGDILVPDLEHARAYFEDQHGGDGEEGESSDAFRLSVMTDGGVDARWTFPGQMRLTYCIDGASFGTDAAALTSALERAAASWSSVIGARFERVAASPCNNTTGTTFNVRKEVAAWNAAAFFPGYDRAHRELLVTSNAFGPYTGGRDLEGILRHELGHTLGFRHEHIWIDCGLLDENPDDDDDVLGTDVDARQLTPYDSDSVMHYPQCGSSPQNGYRQTTLDYRGAASLYGLAPALHASARPL